MIKNHILSLAILCSGFSLAQSPISLSNSNMPGNGDTLRYTTVQPSSLGNYTQTGVNFTWDFKAVTSNTEGVREFKSALQTPYAFYFLSLNAYGEKLADNLIGNTGTVSITNYYNFYRKSTNPNAFLADGVGLTISGIPVAATFSDKDELYNFPMSYPQYDSTTFKFSTLTTTLLPITYMRKGTRVTRVDGWGTVTTPYGTENCIRLVTTQYSQDTIAVSLGTLVPLPPIKFGFPNNQRSYQWLTANSKIPFMEITGSLVGNNFTILTARYRGYDKNANLVSVNGPEADPLTIELYPNPVKDKLWLKAGAQNQQLVQLMDINGRVIRNAETAYLNSQTYVDVADLPAGIYLLKVSEGTQLKQLKFIKE